MVWATLVSQNEYFESYNLIHPETKFGRDACQVDCEITKKMKQMAAAGAPNHSKARSDISETIYRTKWAKWKEQILAYVSEVTKNQI